MYVVKNSMDVTLFESQDFHEALDACLREAEEQAIETGEQVDTFINGADPEKYPDGEWEAGACPDGDPGGYWPHVYWIAD